MNERNKIERVKRELIAKAKEMFTEILPITHLKVLEKGFTFDGNKLMFWFNDKDNGTHLLMETI